MNSTGKEMPGSPAIPPTSDESAGKSGPTPPQFTPGPWRWTREGIVTPDNTFLSVSGVSVPCGYVPDEHQSNDNARLIAAAPDMYAALETMEGVFAVNGEGFLRGKIANQIRAALAKARGIK